jgi:hypothetical protein
MPRRDQYLINVYVDYPGLGDLGTFDTLTGGEVDSEELKYRPGGMAEAVSLGGTKTINNVVAGKMFEYDTDLPKAHTLAKAVGRANVTVTKVHLDVDKNPYGARLVYTGKLKTVSFPEVDSESSEAGIMTLEVSCSGTLG